MGQKLAEKEPLGQSVMHLILEFMVSCQCKQTSKHTHVYSHASVVFETDSTHSAVKIRLVQLFLHY